MGHEAVSYRHISQKLFVGESEFGRGIFAAIDIAHGELIETSPVILFCAEVSSHLAKTDCGERFLFWQKVGAEETLAVACGLVMLANHSEFPNAVIERDVSSDEVALRAEKSIDSGSEVLVKYVQRKTF